LSNRRGRVENEVGRQALGLRET